MRPSFVVSIDGLEYSICVAQSVFRRPGFPPQDRRCSILGPRLARRSLRSRHCCEEPGRVFVWIVGNDGYKLYRIAYTSAGIIYDDGLQGLTIEGPSPTLSSNTTIQRYEEHIIRQRGGQTI